MQTFNFLKPIGIAIFALSNALALQEHEAQSKILPPGVLEALSGDEKAYCDQFEDKTDCREEFRSNLLWRELEIAPSERSAVLVENRNAGACGSAGCGLFLFLRMPNGKFVQVLGTIGEVGELSQVKTLKKITRGHYNIQKTWRDGKTVTVYAWDGSRYSALGK